MNNKKGRRRFVLLMGLMVGLLLISGMIAEAQEEWWPKDQEKWWPYKVLVCYPWGKIEETEWVPSKPAREYTIGLLWPHLKDPYWVNQAYGVFQEAKALGGIKLIMRVAEGYEDLQGQIKQTEAMIARGVDAIIIGAISATGNCASIEEVEKAGIVVVGIAQCAYTNAMRTYCSGWDYQLGVLEAEWIGKDSAGRPVNALLLAGPSGGSFSEARAKGWHDTIKKYPNVNVVATKWGDHVRDVQMSITENMLRAFPDIDYISGGDIAAQAAAVVVAREGLQDKIKITEAWFLREGVEFMKRGWIDMGTLVHGVVQARICVDAAVKLLNGERGVPRMIHPIPTVITPENMEEVLNPIEEWAPKGWRAPAGVIEY